MSKNNITIKGSFKGIIGELVKRVILMIIYGVIYHFSNNYKDTFFSDNSSKSLVTLIMDNPLKALPLAGIIAIYIVLAILALISLYKIIALFYNMKREVNIDFTEERIKMVSYSFPFSKNVEEDKFDKIVTVNIDQKLMDRFFNSGSLYIEYLVSSKVDSNSVFFEIPHLYNPSQVSSELL